jgi:hypothetical protein
LQHIHYISDDSKKLSFKNILKPSEVSSTNLLKYSNSGGGGASKLAENSNRSGVKGLTSQENLKKLVQATPEGIKVNPYP